MAVRGACAAADAAVMKLGAPKNAEPLRLLSLRTQPGFVCVRSDMAVIDRRIRLPLPSRGRDGNLYVRFTGTT